MESSDQTILLRCSKDSEPLVLVSGPQGDVLAVCPICGSGWKYEQVAKQSAGLIAGLLSEEQLLDLKQQIRIARQKGI
jgi:hypothetical protein